MSQQSPRYSRLRERAASVRVTEGRAPGRARLLKEMRERNHRWRRQRPRGIGDEKRRKKDGGHGQKTPGHSAGRAKQRRRLVYCGEDACRGQERESAYRSWSRKTAAKKAVTRAVGKKTSFVFEGACKLQTHIKTIPFKATRKESTSTSQMLKRDTKA